MTDVIPPNEMPHYYMLTDKQLDYEVMRYDLDIPKLKGRELAEAKQKLKAIQREQRSRKR